MKRLNAVFTVLLILSLTGCATVRVGKKKPTKQVTGQTGRNIPQYSLSIDANYDPRLDNLIPGYKLLPVVIRNSSLQAIPMNLRADRWVIIGEKGQKYAAMNSLRLKDPVYWRRVPDQVRTMIDYPEIIPIGYSVTFDLLFPENVNLEYFEGIRYYNDALGKEIVLEKIY